MALSCTASRFLLQAVLSLSLANAPLVLTLLRRLCSSVCLQIPLQLDVEDTGLAEDDGASQARDGLLVRRVAVGEDSVFSLHI